MEREKALKILREAQTGWDIQEALETLIPELRESEDERIRKSLIQFLTGEVHEIDVERAVAWLEKQKEQKPIEIHIDNPNIEKFDPDVKVTTSDSSADGKELLYVSNKSYNIGFRDGVASVKPAEWSEEDEKMLNCTKTQLHILQSHLSHTHSESMSDMEYSSLLLQIEKCVSWLDIRLKSLRPPQDRCKDCPHRGDMFLLTQGIKSGKHDLAIRFMDYLDENRPEGKMGLSNAECEDIDKAFKENDWAKIIRYYEKYGKRD